MLSRIFNSHQTKTITSAAGILAISALVSRILGVFRSGLLANAFGAGSELDVYFAAFRIPDLVYNILIAGGVIVSFLPLFSEYFAKNKEEAWKFVNNVLSIFLFSLVVLSLILFIFTLPILKLITPGFTHEQLAETALLTRMMLLSPILLGLSAIFSGVLQYFNRFLVYSFAPVLYNIGIIFGILFLSPRFGIFGVAMGVVIGAFFHFAIQVPSVISCGFKYQPIFDFKGEGIKKVFLLMIPRTLAIAGLQTNLIVITAIASTLAAGSISVFNFANDIQYFPIGIIGTSFAIAVFPSLTRSTANGIKEEFVKNFSSVLRNILYFIIPLSIFIFILREQIVEIIFKYGKFGQLPAQLTSGCLGLFCFGIFANALVPLVSRAFFAFKDTKTPTIMIFSAMVLNIILSFYLTFLLKSENLFQLFIRNSFSLEGIGDIRVLGLPLAFSLSAIFQIGLLLVFLYIKIGDFNLREIFNSFIKIILASALMTLGIYFMIHSLQTAALFQVAIVVPVGFIIYFVLTFLLKSPEAEMIFKKLFHAKH